MHTTYLKYLTVSIISTFLMSLIISAQSVEEMNNIGIPLSVRFESSEYNGGMQCWSFDQDSTGILYVGNNNGLLEFDGLDWKRYEVPNSNKLRSVLVDSKNRIYVGGQGQVGYFERTNSGLTYRSLMDLLPAEYKNIAETWKIFELDNNIFFVTESQLLEYDGENIRMLNLPGVLVNAFLVNNTIWIQIYTQGLYQLHDTEFRSIPNTSGINEVREIFSNGGGFYFFTVDGSIIKYYSGNPERLSSPTSLGMINSVIRLNNSDFVVGTHNNGLFILDNSMNIKRHYTKHKGISDRTIRAVFEDNFNNLWIALNNGIDYLEISLPFALINDKVGLDGTGYAACSFSGRVYLGTNNGLFELEKSDDAFNSFSYRLIPGSEGQVYNFSVAGEKLFLNHHHGAFVIDESEIDQFHYIGSWKIMETPVNGLFIGGDYRGINYFLDNDNSLEYHGSIPGFNESSRMMEFDSDSSLWMTHGSKGAFRFLFDENMQLSGEVKLYGQDHGFPSNYKVSIYSLIDKFVFTADQGIYEYNYEKDVFERNTFFDLWLGNDHVSALADAIDQSIYFIQDDELGTLKHKSFGNYQKETATFKHINKYISDDLRNITVLDKDHVLIGGKEGFIIYYPNRESKRVSEFNVQIRSVEIEYSSDSMQQFFNPFYNSLELFRDQSIKIHYAAPYFEGYDELRYSYRLLPLDTNWSQWASGGEERFSYLPANSYTFQVKALNIYDQESEISSLSFAVVNPWYLTESAMIGYIFLGLVIILLILLHQQKKYDVEKTLITKDKDKVLKIKDQEITQISEDSQKEIQRLQNERLKTEVDLKNDQLTTITMHMMNNNTKIQDALKNIFVKLEKGGSRDELKRIIRSIEKDLIKDDTWNQFEHHFDQVHGDYLKNLSMSDIHLSPREIKLAAFLRMNMSSKEISKMMNITVKSVELARHRLRKKLKLSRDQNLVEYLMGLDIN